MKIRLLVMTVLLTSFAAAFSQSPYRIYTTPKLPARDALDRMNLTLAWRTRVNVEGQRDGIASIQVIPGKPNQLVVQSHRGWVFLYDADNGDLIWKTGSVGVPYWDLQPAGWNSQCIFVSRRNILHVLNRKTGNQRVYTYEPPLRDPIFGFTLQLTPSATLVADEEFLYVCMASRLHAIYIPDFDGLERVKKAADETERKKPKDKKDDPTEEKKEPEPGQPIKKDLDSPQPFVYWGYKIGGHVTDAPALFSDEQICMITSTGLLVSLNRYEEGARKERFEFQVKGSTHNGATQHGGTAYFGSDDFNAYAVNMANGDLLWRHVAGAPVLRRPDVNDRDIFIAPERLGLRKLDRLSGREQWTNRDVQKFLAANHQFVYALDHLGKFHVLDAKRGTKLASLDMAEWAVPVSNELTDRIYLAANDGQIICLRHRDLTKPLVMKTVEEYKTREQKKPMEDKKKDDEKKEDKDKDKDKGALGTWRPDVALISPRLEASRRAGIAVDLPVILR